jgi:hypothetical protein
MKIVIRSAVLWSALVTLSFGLSISKVTDIFKSGVSNQQPYPLIDTAPFVEPVYFSQAAFCDPKPGDTIRGAQVYWSGGDGRDIPKIFIAHNDQLGIILSNQGTNVTDVKSIENVSVS